MNKRGDTEWTVRKVVVLILLLILLVIIIFGLISGKFVPMYERVGGMIDGVLVFFGIHNSGSSTLDDNCEQKSVSFKLDDGKVENVVFEHCYYYNQETCTLKGFSDLSIYYYYPDSGELKVKRKDSGYYKLDIDLSGGAKNSDVDEVFYNSVKFIYDVFGVRDGGRRNRYSIKNYIEYDMGDYFGKFGDLFIMYGDESHSYFMAANGRYLVFDMDDLDEDDLTWFEGLFVDIEPVNMNPVVITPIVGAFNDKPDWVKYDGMILENALAEFKELTTTFNNVDYDLKYTVCSPISSNTVYENCYVKSGVVKGELYDLIVDVYLNNKHEEVSEPNSLDRSSLVDLNSVELLKIYIKNEDEKYREGVTRYSNPATKFNELLKEKEMDSFFVNDKKFIVEGRASTDEWKFPLIRVRSVDNKEIYYLRFEGLFLYKRGETEFFLSEGNKIMPPFSLYDKDMNEVDVSREFEQTAGEDELDLKVIDYFKKECP